MRCSVRSTRPRWSDGSWCVDSSCRSPITGQWRMASWSRVLRQARRQPNNWTLPQGRTYWPGGHVHVEKLRWPVGLWTRFATGPARTCRGRAIGLDTRRNGSDSVGGVRSEPPLYLTHCPPLLGDWEVEAGPPAGGGSRPQRFLRLDLDERGCQHVAVVASTGLTGQRDCAGHRIWHPKHGFVEGTCEIHP